MIHAHFSPEGWVIGVVLATALIVLPVALMGLRSKNFFRRSAQIPTR